MLPRNQIQCVKRDLGRKQRRHATDIMRRADRIDVDPDEVEPGAGFQHSEALA